MKSSIVYPHVYTHMDTLICVCYVYMSMSFCGADLFAVCVVYTALHTDYSVYV